MAKSPSKRAEKKSDNILGITHGGPGGVALFQDEKLSLAVNEERLTGIKMDRSYPHNSINWLLEESGLAPKDIDTICYGFSNGIGQGEFVSSLVRRVKDYLGDSRALEAIFERLSTEAEVDAKKRREFFDETGKIFPGVPIYSCSHHQANQASAYMGSPFEKALVV